MTRGKTGLVASALVFVAVVAGCSQEEPGTAVSGGSTPTGQSSSASTPRSTSTSPAGSSIDGIDPCDLLPSSAASGIGLTPPGKPRSASGRPVCSWQGSEFGVLVGTSDKGLAGASGQSLPGTRHKAIQTTDTGGFGGCGVYVEVSATSSVIVVAVLNGGKPAEQACPKAVEAAKIVDTTLP